MTGRDISQINFRDCTHATCNTATKYILCWEGKGCICIVDYLPACLLNIGVRWVKARYINSEYLTIIRTVRIGQKGVDEIKKQRFFKTEKWTWENIRDSKCTSATCGRQKVWGCEFELRSKSCSKG